MERNNAIETFLYIFGQSDLEETRAQAVRLISAMCSNDNRDCQRTLCTLNGIANLIKPIEKYVANRKPEVGRKAGLNLEGMATGGEMKAAGVDDLQDPLENPYGGDISILIIAILDCVSKGVVGNAGNESEFADKEGVDALLNLLEISPYVLRIQILRVISDILRNRYTHTLHTLIHYIHYIHYIHSYTTYTTHTTGSWYAMPMPGRVRRPSDRPVSCSVTAGWMKRLG